MSTANAPEAPTDPSPEAAWHPAQRVLFRFFSLYFLLYSFPAPFHVVPGVRELTQWYSAAWDALIPWVGENLLGKSITIRPAGSGDTTYNYVQLLVMLLLALLGTVVWTLIDRRRLHYRKLWRWLVVAGRYYLAFIMLNYGFAKVFKSQFPSPSLERLSSTVGEMSPMGLAWTFMGYSKAYNLFTGAGEVVAGLLLLFRRTTTLGALVAIAVMSNVVMMNFSYDIPVKLFSTHLLLLAVMLLALDSRRMLNVLVLNRPAEAMPHPPHFTSPRGRTLRRVAKTLLILLALHHTGSRALEVRVRSGSQLRSPLYGLYDVESFVVDGETLPPLSTNDRRWRHLIVERKRMRLRYMDGTMKNLSFLLGKEGLTVFPPSSDAKRFHWTYRRPSPDVLELEGEFEGHQLSVQMTRRDVDDFLLMNRGFHWVNEYPFHR